MRETINDSARLEHMLQAIGRIQSFVIHKSKEDINRDAVLYYALVKNIEIIGEAAYMLTPGFRDSHPSSPWRVIIGMRHFLVHGYYEVDPCEVWNVIEKDLPLLQEQIKQYLTEF
ncbi:MAG: DUF86 domain-containing protein [Bacteroidales bacterium]|nr:DUF86 domain-containing protein [Bacteroidales bacterium]